MKKALVPAIVYIVFYLSAAVLMTGAILLYHSVIGYSPALSLERSFFTFLPQALSLSIPAAAALSMMLILLVQLNFGGGNLIASLLILLFATALYALPLPFVFQLESEPDSRYHFPFDEQSLSQTEELLLYIDKIKTSPAEDAPPTVYELEGVSILDTDGATPKIAHYFKAEVDVAASLISSEDGERLVNYGARNSLNEELVDSQKVLGNLSADIESLSRALRESAAQGWIPLLIHSFAHVLFLAASWGVIRTSRWPLLNAILAILIFRGFFYLDTLFRGEIVQEGLTILKLHAYSDYAVSAGFAILALLFLLWGMTFSRTYSQKEARR